MVLVIFKMIATSNFLTALECTKFVFGPGSARTPLGELTTLPKPPSWFKRNYFEGGGRKVRERGRGEERKVSPPPPFADSLIRSCLVIISCVRRLK